MGDEKAPVGGGFVLETAEPEQIFTPEEFSTDASLMVRSVEEFMRREVLPAQARIEAAEEGFMSRLVRQAGDLGLLGAGVPERYGGLDLPKSTLLRLAETTALNLPFAISVGVHAGVGV